MRSFGLLGGVAGAQMHAAGNGTPLASIIASFFCVSGVMLARAGLFAAAVKAGNCLEV